MAGYAAGVKIFYGRELVGLHGEGTVPGMIIIRKENGTPHMMVERKIGDGGTVLLTMLTDTGDAIPEARSMVGYGTVSPLFWMMPKSGEFRQIPLPEDVVGELESIAMGTARQN